MSQLTRRKFIEAGAAAATATSLLPAISCAQPAKPIKKRPNVLFLIVDDLRPQLNCYGHEQMVTPNLDKLAAQGTLFERGYCQQGVCAPSRISLLSGLRPDSTTISGMKTPLSESLPDVMTMPRLFKSNGYTTVSLGKVYHHIEDDPQGWSRPPELVRGKQIGRGYMIRSNATRDAKDHPQGPSTERADVPDNSFHDGALAERGIKELGEFKKSGEPFFLALGFFKPHLPFAVPNKYWEMYDRDKIGLPPSYFPPKGVPEIAMHDWEELRNYTDIPAQGPVSDDKARELIHGYYAGVSYTDALIGSVLDELERLQMADDTIVVFCVDHGWSLGDNSLWCKQSNFERSVHTPMIVRVPGQQKAGGRVASFVEWVDIYPSICDMVGLEKPAHLQGQSFGKSLKDPTVTHKTMAFSQFPRRYDKGEVMGYTMRTDRYRFTTWGKYGTELYDHQTDPNETETVAIKPENAALVEKLRAQMVAVLPTAAGLYNSGKLRSF